MAAEQKEFEDAVAAVRFLYLNHLRSFLNGDVISRQKVGEIEPFWQHLAKAYGSYKDRIIKLGRILTTAEIARNQDMLLQREAARVAFFSRFPVIPLQYFLTDIFYGRLLDQDGMLNKPPTIEAHTMLKQLGISSGLLDPGPHNLTLKDVVGRVMDGSLGITPPEETED